MFVYLINVGILMFIQPICTIRDHIEYVFQICFPKPAKNVFTSFLLPSCKNRFLLWKKPVLIQKAQKCVFSYHNWSDHLTELMTDLNLVVCCPGLGSIVIVIAYFVIDYNYCATLSYIIFNNVIVIENIYCCDLL